MFERFDREELRRVSRAAFGQAYRLELMLAVAASPDGLCTLTELTRELGVTMSSLQKPFQALVEIGLLTPLPYDDTKFRYYARTPSAAWEWAVQLSEAAAQASQQSAR